MEKFLKLSLPLAASVATRGTRSDRETLLLAGWLPFFVQPELSKPGTAGAALGQREAGRQRRSLGSGERLR